MYVCMGHGLLQGYIRSSFRWCMYVRTYWTNYKNNDGTKDTKTHCSCQILINDCCDELTRGVTATTSLTLEEVHSTLFTYKLATLADTPHMHACTYVHSCYTCSTPQGLPMFPMGPSHFPAALTHLTLCLAPPQLRPQLFAVLQSLDVGHLLHTQGVGQGLLLSHTAGQLGAVRGRGVVGNKKYTVASMLVCEIVHTHTHSRTTSVPTCLSRSLVLSLSVFTSALILLILLASSLSSAPLLC